MSAARAVVVERVTKRYPAAASQPRTLRGLLSRRLPTLLAGGDAVEVLSGVSFTAARGESVGLIGRNGAGKSTVLRLLAGLSRPTAGTVDVRGATRAVLTLGEAFDPTLSGAENAVTTAMVGGLREREARGVLSAILAFAELEAFADAPVRTYSEGMKLRLAMAVVAHLPGDVLLLDEVLAVGDLAFQDRCLAHVRERRQRGATLVLASHDLDRVAAECDTVVWLEDGRVRAHGEARTVVDAYRRALLDATLDRTPAGLGPNRFGTQEVRIEDVRVDPAGTVEPHGALSVALRLAAEAPWPRRCAVTVSVHRRADGLKCLDANTGVDGVAVEVGERGADVRLALEELPLVPGEYDLEVGAYRPDWEYAYDLHAAAYPLRVAGGPGGPQGVALARRRWSVRAP